MSPENVVKSLRETTFQNNKKIQKLLGRMQKAAEKGKTSINVKSLEQNENILLQLLGFQVHHQPKFETNEDGQIGPVKDERGNPVMESSMVIW